MNQGSRDPAGQPKAGDRHAADEAQRRLTQGLALHQARKFAEARTLYEQVLDLLPDHPDALHLLGVVASQTQDHARAVELIDRAIGIKADDAAYHCNRANALRALGRLDAALASYDQAIRLKPDFAAAHNGRGNALRELGRPDQALRSYDEALRLAPASPQALTSRGNTLRELGRLVDAVASYDAAIRLRPDHVSAHSNRGVTLHDLRRFEDALASHDEAIRLNPAVAEAWNNRGLTLLDLGRADAALGSFDEAIRLRADYANAHSNRGLTLEQLQRPVDAVESYGRAVALRPDDGFLYGTWLHARMRLCDWDGIDTAVAGLLARIEQGLPATPPFAVLAITDSAAVQRRAAEIAVAARHPARLDLPPAGLRSEGGRIRIGYFSADYHEHATAYLMAELFERHDRERFELVAFSFGPDRQDAMRRRLVASFDRFIDVRDKSDTEVALLSRSLGIDIAVDLKGFTQGHRLGIFACRAAPVQVSYLGYPGTLGARYMDYLVADEVVVPVAHAQYYAEKIAWLPGSYQVNDRQRVIADRSFSRVELGLPADGFVFCCFNNNFKITPATFDAWMRILARVEGSVLWLLEDNPVAADNLRRAASARGMDADRLVFARRMPLAEHLARHRAADLFLDTLPCNAHTTASDALWAGLPVLTCPGQALASRVAASLLAATDLSDLIAATPAEYEALAIDLASDPERLGRMRARLEHNRLTSALFDTPRFARHLEAAYTRMVERCRAGLAPGHIRVEP